MILYEVKTKPIEIRIMDHHSFMPHVHSALELIICTAGQLKASCRQHTEILRPGDAMIAFSHELHAYHETAGGSGTMLIVNPGVLTLFTTRLQTRKYENFLLTQNPKLLHLAEEIHQEAAAGVSADVLTGYLYILLGLILQDLPYRPVTEQIASQDTFTQVLEYLSSHYTEPLSLEALAGRFGINHAHLSRTFAAKLSCGYLDYLHQLRIEHAKKLLSETQNKVSDIAFESGFSDQRSFNRVFKRYTNLTPSAYRQMIRQNECVSCVGELCEAF